MAANKRGKRPTDFGALDYLFAHCAVIRGTTTVWDDGVAQIIGADALRFAYPVAAKTWLESPERRMIHPSQLKFDPSGESIEQGDVNMFRGFPVEPAQGDCGPLLQLLNHLCGGHLETVDFVQRWLALPLQRPGTKMHSALVFHGDEGTGKNRFFGAVGQIYGDAAITIGQLEIESAYNAWASRKLYVIADEVITRAEMAHHKGRLRTMITGETVLINDKHMPLRSEPNLSNYIFFSNEVQPLLLDQSDRRYAVVWTPPPDQQLLDEVIRCIDSGGIAALYWHLLHRVDCSGFDAHTKPPATQAKADLIELGMPSALRFWAAWAGGDLPLPFEAVRSMDLFAAYRVWMHTMGDRFVMSQTRFSREIKRHCSSERLWCRLPGAGVRDRPIMLVPPESLADISWLRRSTEYELGDRISSWRQDLLAYAEASGYKGL